MHLIHCFKNYDFNCFSTIRILFETFANKLFKYSKCLRKKSGMRKKSEEI